ncbi:MAG: hypothetical protein PVG92_01905 [Holophagae bacterium]|jgi:hypothetical protein
MNVAIRVFIALVAGLAVGVGAAALDLIPDMFITTANVTANMTVAAVLGRLEHQPADQP